MKKEIQILLTAIMFYTRIPVPNWIDHSENLLNKATRYFPFMGWMVGGFTAGIFYLCMYILPSEVSLLLSISAGVLLTGAFHEDGFADFCDAFGGGWSKQKILDIMKDSRVGAFGAIGLMLILALKFFTLQAMPFLLIIKSLLLGHILSRYAATVFLYTSRYVRENEDSKAKPVGKKMEIKEIILASIFGLAPLALFPWKYLLILLPVSLCLLWFRRYLHKWIGGYTGDCLGAIQQVNEVLIYLTVISLMKL
ncbi:MAG: adenosylcobinamide-GDP ribazoletransferase [Cyclobacteriaceae bacterium]